MKNSFMAGALILMAANAVSKVLGAVFKIPLTYIIHEEGMAIYNTAFGVYAMFLTFVISGMPFAVQKTVAEYKAAGNMSGARGCVRMAALFLAAAGAVCSCVMYFGAEFFAAAMKEERAVWAIRFIAPSVFLVGCGAAVKSGFQGAGKMLPTAVSQVAEAAVKLAAGYMLAVYLLNRGINGAAAGAAAGVTAGELLASLLLIVWYLGEFRKIKAPKKGRKEILKNLMGIAIPLLAMSVITSAVSICDTAVLRLCLLKSGMSAEEARFVYGAYTGYAMTVLNLPSGFLATIGVSIIPVISGANSLGNMKRVKAAAGKGLFLTASAALCLCVCLALWGDKVLYILFHNTYSAPMLRCAVPSVLFICVMQFSGAVLQSMGYIGRSFISSAAAVTVKLAVTIILVPIPDFNIYGSIIGTDLGFFIGAVLNMWFMADALRG